jgi:hypothetical protein
MGGTQSMLPTKMWTASREDSEQLAMKIRNYWFARGYTVKTEVYGLSELGESYPSGAHIYSVRSNMVGGFPNRDPNAPINVPLIVPRRAAIVPRSEHQMVRA